MKSGSVANISNSTLGPGPLTCVRLPLLPSDRDTLLPDAGDTPPFSGQSSRPMSLPPLSPPAGLSRPPAGPDWAPPRPARSPPSFSFSQTRYHVGPARRSLVRPIHLGGASTALRPGCSRPQNRASSTRRPVRTRSPKPRDRTKGVGSEVWSRPDEVCEASWQGPWLAAAPPAERRHPEPPGLGNLRAHTVCGSSPN